MIVLRCGWTFAPSARRITSSGGNLVLAGSVGNFEDGLLATAEGSQLTIARGLGTNSAIINLLGRARQLRY